MRAVLQEHAPTHAVFGEEGGMHAGKIEQDGSHSGYLWVLDPIDGTKSFITGRDPQGCTISTHSPHIIRLAVMIWGGCPLLGPWGPHCLVDFIAGRETCCEHHRGCGCTAGKPVFGTLIALLKDGTPVLGVLDQPITKERWVGAVGQQTTLNGVRCSLLTFSQHILVWIRAIMCRATRAVTTASRAVSS